MLSWGMEVERWLKMGLTKLKFLRQYSLCNCDHLHDTEHWSDNRLCCYTWFQTFSTYIYQSFYIYLRFNSLLIVKGWKKLSFSTQDHNSKKFHRKKNRYDNSFVLYISSWLPFLFELAYLHQIVSNLNYVSITFGCKHFFKHSLTTNSCFGRE